MDYTNCFRFCVLYPANGSAFCFPSCSVANSEISVYYMMNAHIFSHVLFFISFCVEIRYNSPFNYRNLSLSSYNQPYFSKSQHVMTPPSLPIRHKISQFIMLKQNSTLKPQYQNTPYLMLDYLQKLHEIY